MQVKTKQKPRQGEILGGSLSFPIPYIPLATYLPVAL